MMFEVNKSSEGKKTCLDITGDLTIYEAAEFKEKLISELMECQELDVNLASVSEIDTSGIQVLMLAKNESKSLDKVFKIVSHSQPVLNLIEGYRLADFFGDPILISEKQSAA